MVTGGELFVSLLNNLAISIALVAIYRFLLVRIGNPNRTSTRLVYGLVFGVFAIGSMFARIPVFDGVIVDQRNAIVALSGAFGGPASAIATALMAGLLRAYLGGNGVLAGLIGLGLAGVSGMILHRFSRGFSSAVPAALNALVATLIILPGFLFVGDPGTGWGLLKAMALPYGSAIFLGISFVGLLLERERERFRIERSLRENEEKYRVLFESFPLGITVTDANGTIIETNTAPESDRGPDDPVLLRHALDGSEERLLRHDGTELPPDELPGRRALRENQRIDNAEIGVVDESGHTTWLNTTAAPIPLDGYGVAITYNDITDRKNAVIRLNQTLEEKSVLLQELYHRTRNNMQVITALLEWQSINVEDPRVRSILRETQNRIRSMALVHQKLYQSHDLSSINLKSYVAELVVSLMESYEVSPERVRVSFETEDVYVLIDSAIPFGLIFEELVSNALRHAFGDDRLGMLRIRLHRNGDGEILLAVEDDGIGLSPGLDPRLQGRLGLQTVFALGEQQLQGRVTVTSVDGVTCTLQFKDNLYSTRV